MTERDFKGKLDYFTMTVYISTHFNFARFLNPVPRDEYDRYTKIVQWFLENRFARGTLSANSLFLLSNMWGNKTIIKNLSKLCLAGQLELSASMYSSYIPLNLSTEEKVIENQILNALDVMNDIFPRKYIKGYYPPFGIWDTRSTKVIAEKGFKYIIMDWHVIAKALNPKPKGTFEFEFFKPFKLKGQNIFVLPSFNLRSAYRNYPDMQTEAIKSGELESLWGVIKNAVKVSTELHEDFFGILTIDINDMRFPIFPPNYDFENFLNETKGLMKQDVSFLRPSDVIEKFDNIQEIDVPSYLPFEITLTKGFQRDLKPSPCCSHYSNLFDLYLNRIEILENRNRDSTPEVKQKVTNLLKYSMNYFILKQHNFCFDVFSEPIKGIDNAKNLENWKSVSHLNLILNVAEGILNGNLSKQSILENFGNECTNSLFIGDNILCGLMNKGGIITNLIDLKKGIVMTSCPSENLAIDKTTQEPLYGLMYDVVSKKHSGQFNLFSERYTYDWEDRDDGKSVILSCYASENVLLSKQYEFENNSSKIKVKYKLKNFGNKADAFRIYSISKVNLGEHHTHYLSHETIKVSEENSDDRNKIVNISNKDLNSYMNIKVPKDITVKTEGGFGNIELIMKIDVPSLKNLEEKVYSFEIDIVE